MQKIKRLLSLALALVMVLSIVPATVFAADSAPALPTAKISQIKNDDLTFAMNFRVNSVTEEQLAYYGNWYADFELTINKEVTFNNDGSADGWLAGQYDEWSYDWVTVPFGKKAPVTVKANETVKIMAFAAEFLDEPGLKYTFKEVYETVKDFNCGVYFDDEFLANNPDLEVTLELKMYNPANEAESYIVGETYTYTNPIVAKNINTGKVYTSVNDAMMAAQVGETVVLLKDVSETIVSVFEDATLDLNGYTLAAQYVSCFGDIIDSSAANTGLLSVSANRFMIREDNAQLPIRNGNGYRFVEVLKFNAKYDAASSIFGFQPFVEAGALEWLKEGSAATGVTIQVQITWKQSTGYRSQNFVYNDTTVNDFLGSYISSTGKYGKMLFLTLKGAENFDELTFTATVVSDTKVSFTPESLAQQKPTGNVTTNAQNQVVNDVTIGNGNASALVPSGTQLENGAYNVTLNATEMEKTTSNITLGDGEQLVSMNVHVDGVAANNTKPIIVTLANLAPEALNQGNVNLYHVENGETVLMTRVYSIEEVDAHNEYYYNIATGTVTMALATFSEIAVRSNVRNPWNGTINTDWYNTADIAFDIYNADQLAGLSAIVGGMAAGIEQDSFKGKTLTLYADIDLNDTEGDSKIFYPIGYWNNTLSYEHISGKVMVDGVETAVSSGFYTFEGTFDGNGNTIANFYQNTWEMFGDYNDGYSGTPNYYRDGMGLFGKVYGGTIKNLTVDNFKSDGEFATTGCIAAYADCGATFENISITNCNPRVYNIGNGGIVGCVGWYGKETSKNPVTFRNITVDNSNKITALWGSWDVACGGIVGQYYPTSGQSAYDYPASKGLYLENCHVAAQIDVYNDVCANYQYYAYRYSGMLIGSVRENVTIGGHSYPKMDGITATGCTAFFGDWNDYYYCELVANSQASYTHDYQMSRLTQVAEVDVDNKTITTLEGKTEAIPSGRVNYVVVKTYDNEKGAWIHGDGHEYAECYHFVDGNVWTHDMAGEQTGVDENNDGITDLKEDKQLIYREFNNLVTGYGWGVTSRGFNNLEGVENFGVAEGESEDSIVKFVPVVGAGTSINAGHAISIGKLFAANTGATSAIGIKRANVQVFVSPADETSTVRGSYVAGEDDWTKGALVFSGTGAAIVTITDYYYCTATTLMVNVLREDAKIECVDNNLIANSTFGEFKDVVSYPVKTNNATDFKAMGYVVPSGLANVTAEVTNRYAKDGTYSLHLTQKNAAAFSIYQDIALPEYGENTRVVLSASRRGTSKAEQTRMYFQFLGANGDLGRSGISYFESSEAWVTDTISATIPDGATTVRVYIAYIRAAAEADIYIDNVTLKINDEPVTLTNPSFDTILPSGTPSKINEFVLNAENWSLHAEETYSSSVVTDPVNAGNGVLELQDYSSDAYPRTDSIGIPVKPGSTYTLTMQYKAPEGVTGTSISVYLRGNRADANGVPLCDKNGAAVARVYTEDATTAWKSYTATTVKIPENVTTLYVTFTPLTDGGTVYIDNIVLTENCVHTWDKANVIEEATCTKEGISIRTCTGCGATETVTAKHNPTWKNGVCTSCEFVCVHDVIGGVCLICKAELPQHKTENLISNSEVDAGDWTLRTNATYSSSVGKDPADDQNDVLVLWDNDTGAQARVDSVGLNVKPGLTYTFTMYYKASEVVAGNEVTVYLRGNYASSSGEPLVYTKSGAKYAANTEEITTEWQKLTVTTIEIPDTVTKLYLTFVTEKAGISTVYIDDITVVANCSHEFKFVDETDGYRNVVCQNCGATGTSQIAP